MSTVTDAFKLTGPEERLIKAAEDDEVADLRRYADEERPVIRANVLCELCAGSMQWRVKDRIRVIGARVQGRFDLYEARLTHPLHFTDCVFEDTIDLRRARATTPVEWVGAAGAVTAEILADEFESDSDLTIRDITVTDVVSLQCANVGGDLRLSDCHLKSTRDPVLDQGCGRSRMLRQCWSEGFPVTM